MLTSQTLTIKVEGKFEKHANGIAYFTQSEKDGDKITQKQKPIPFTAIGNAFNFIKQSKTSEMDGFGTGHITTHVSKEEVGNRTKFTLVIEEFVEIKTSSPISTPETAPASMPAEDEIPF